MSVTTDSIPEAKAPAPLLELHGAVDPEGHADAVIPVRWCVGPELAKILQEKGVIRPYLLLVVRPFTWAGDGERRRKVYQGESLRKLVPLLDEMAYVSFSRPGNNEVFATVVYNKEGHGAFLELGPLFTGGYPYNYRQTIFEYDGSVNHMHHERKSGKVKYEGTILSSLSDTIDVSVPAEMFAKEYPDWVKTYVGKFFQAKPKDQCHMRRRTLFFAAPFSIIYFPIAYLVRTVTLAAGLLLGLRGLEPNGFLHPIESGMFDVVANADNVKRSVWFKDTSRNRRPMPVLMLNPISALLAGTIFWTIGTYHVTRNEQIVGLVGWAWWKYFAAVYLAQVGLAAAFLLILGVLAVISAMIGSSLSKRVSVWSSSRWDRLSAKRNENKERARQEQKVRALKELDRELSAMVCRPTGAGVSLEALPKRKRTVHLRFEETKRKVCRPFAR